MMRMRRAPLAMLLLLWALPLCASAAEPAVDKTKLLEAENAALRRQVRDLAKDLEAARAEIAKLKQELAARPPKPADPTSRPAAATQPASQPSEIGPLMTTMKIGDRGTLPPKIQIWEVLDRTSAVVNLCLPEKLTVEIPYSSETQIVVRPSRQGTHLVLKGIETTKMLRRRDHTIPGVFKLVGVEEHIVLLPNGRQRPKLIGVLERVSP